MNQHALKQQPSRGFAQPAFVVVSAILLLSAVVFNGFVWNLKLHFKKDAVPQPREFREIPALMGHWLQVSQDDKLDKETEDILGTEKYLYRDYIQVDRAGADFMAYLAADSVKTGATTQPSDLDAARDLAADAARGKFNLASFGQQVQMITDALKGKTPNERKDILTAVEMRGHSGDVIHLGLTYYTGLVDTVAHIPDRCYIADGYEPSSYTVPTWKLGPNAAGQYYPLSVRFISFQDSTGSNRVSKCVAYVFHTNGHYESDPLGVRQTLEDLTERYGYYAKIELMTLGEDTDVASTAMTEFLTVARPQIETCFPDWNKLKRQSHS
ncbi:MAG TPA: hypothetical protein VHX86_03695 [Tepidisphaeraceae bacterium]|nr:hypothetical protein [Tepidisphaeraceae bacterium]